MMRGQPKNRESLVVVADNLKLVRLRDEGVDVQFFGALQSHTSLSKAVLANFIGVDPTTIDNYRKYKKKFTGDSAEKILTLHRLFALGEELFGSTHAFVDWLYMPSAGLEGKNPADMLHSITGMGEIEKQLRRIIHGYVA